MQIESHKTIYQLFIKNISKIFLSALIFAAAVACSKSIDDDIKFKIENIKCGISNSSLDTFFLNDFDFQKNDRIFISNNEQRYKEIINYLNYAKKLDNENLIDEKYSEYNSIFLINSKPTSGFKLKLNDAILKNHYVLNLYFEEISPKSNSIVNTIVTQPYCLMGIDNIDKYDIKVIVE